jgi:micrococcal nuclease
LSSFCPEKGRSLVMKNQPSIRLLFRAVALSILLAIPHTLSRAQSTAGTSPSLPPSAAPYNARCISVIDGDTITVEHDGHPEHIRLSDIDAPEAAQPFGTSSTLILSKLILNKLVRVIPDGHDRYGRTLATLLLPPSLNVNATMIRNGIAWHAVQYSSDPALSRHQDLARGERRGLWRDPSPVPPWVFRNGPAASLPAIKAASFNGDTSQAFALLLSSGLPLDTPLTPENYSLLRLSIMLRDRQTAEALLAAGASPNARARDGSTPLHSAALAGAAFTSLLLAAGADRSRTDSHGVTPLQEADRAGRADVVDLLRASPPAVTAAQRLQARRQASGASSALSAPPSSNSLSGPSPDSARFPSARASGSDTVYVTKSGSRFHRSGCRFLSRSAVPMARVTAAGRGFSPCQVCKP